MNEYITFGLFSLYVAVVSLVLVLFGSQDSLLALLRRFWGRAIGHSLYFGARVALPLLICVLCMGWGVRHYDAAKAFSSVQKPLQLNIENYREFLVSTQNEKFIDTLGVIYGA